MPQIPLNSVLLGLFIRASVLALFISHISNRGQNWPFFIIKLHKIRSLIINHLALNNHQTRLKLGKQLKYKIKNKLSVATIKPRDIINFISAYQVSILALCVDAF